MDNIDLESRLRQMEDVDPILNAYDQAYARYADVQMVQKTVGTNNESLLEFINTFEQMRPSNMSIESFSCQNGEISIAALADSKETVARLIQQLNTITNISEVQTGPLTSSFDSGQETVSFSLTCTLVNAGSMFAQDDTPDNLSETDSYDAVSDEPAESESQVTILDE
jgi:type IV pilus assembly protein PilM